jgi:hypothetical protein
MNSDIITDILKYVDCFGTTFSFYTERSRKFYTRLGGILTLLSIIIGIIIFIYINLDDFFHNIPNSTTSTTKEIYRNIKFGEEKIWIPWRIRDFGGKTINHFNLLYPIIYYYRGIRNYSTNRMDIYYEFLNYKSCNETSMINNSDLYMIDINIDQLYCIEMEDLDIGGSWDSDFLNLITLDLYNCKDGIDYDENNTNCTSYDKIDEISGDNNNFQFEIYYPVVKYQPMNKTNPIFIKYTNSFYHLSRYSNKIERLYLQQYILNDDQGIISKNVKSYSEWGIVSLNGDSYSNGKKRDLMNEGSTSRLYSFNIYIKNEITFYNRSYKKLFLIIADGLPIVNIVFVIFRIIAKVLKISSGNKKLTELLFENLKEKKAANKVEILHKIGTNLNLNNNNSPKHNNNDSSKNQLTYNQDFNKKNNLFNKKRKYSTKSYKYDKNKNSNKKVINKKLNSNKDNNVINNNINFNIKNIESLFSDKNNIIFSNMNFEDSNNKSEPNDQRSLNNKILDISHKQYIRKSLFPYKYYLCSIFIKNINTSKNNIFFTKKFIAVYNFVCQLFDISSYLVLQREFQIMKNTLMIKKYKNIIEKGHKINVNDRFFNIDMNECLNYKKLSILGKVKQLKNNF